MGVFKRSELSSDTEWGTPSPDGDMIVRTRFDQIMRVQPPVSRLAVEETLRTQGVDGGVLSAEDAPVTVVHVTARTPYDYYNGPSYPHYDAKPAAPDDKIHGRLDAVAEGLTAISDASQPGEADLAAILKAVAPVYRAPVAAE